MHPQKRVLVVVGVFAIAAWAVVMRCLHLLNPDHYYILSPDSHFFHWQVSRLLSSQAIPLTWHSGLTYPLLYAAKTISLISGMTSVEALTLAGKLMPPALGAVSVLAIYLAASRMYSQRVGLWAAFTWAILGTAVFVQTAGYLDRDGLSILLLMTSVFLFHFSGEWHFKVGGKDIGWFMVAMAVIVIEALLFLEWLWLGAVILLTVLTASVAMDVAVNFLLRSAQSLAGEMTGTALLRRFLSDGAAAVRQSNWRPLVLIGALSLVGGMIYPGLHLMLQTAAELAISSSSGTSGVAELQPVSMGDLYGYGIVIVPLAVGVYIAVTKRRKADLLCLSWFVSLLFLGIFANRLFLYAVPASCVLCGLGLASIFRFKGVSSVPGHINIGGDMLPVPSPRFLRIVLAVLGLVVLLPVPTYLAYHIGDNDRIAANTEWQAALAFLKEETAEDSVVMSWWDYGYWILDLADRRPVVDNGYYGWDEKRLVDIGLAYCTDEPSQALQVMRKYGADYLVFSRMELEVVPVISQYGLDEAYGDGGSVPKELRPSLYYQSLYGNFQSGGGLRRAYPSPEVTDPVVVILEVE